jgi:hypothetical protein
MGWREGVCAVTILAPTGGVRVAAAEGAKLRRSAGPPSLQMIIEKAEGQGLPGLRRRQAGGEAIRPAHGPLGATSLGLGRRMSIT